MEDMMDYDIDFADRDCPKCGSHTLRRDCSCYEGYSYHSCGEDCCCCADPEPNVVCDLCDGHGWCNWCPNCGWDLLCNRYLNGRDERQLAAQPEEAKE